MPGALDEVLLAFERFVPAIALVNEWQVRAGCVRGSVVFSPHVVLAVDYV